MPVLKVNPLVDLIFFQEGAFKVKPLAFGFTLGIEDTSYPVDRAGEIKGGLLWNPHIPYPAVVVRDLNDRDL